MSRFSKKLESHPYTNYIGGNDETLGQFVDICDRRFATSDADEQGEGYILEYSTALGISTNLIKATMEDIKAGPEKLQQLVEKFIRDNFDEIEITYQEDPHLDNSFLDFKGLPTHYYLELKSGITQEMIYGKVRPTINETEHDDRCLTVEEMDIQEEGHGQISAESLKVANDFLSDEKISKMSSNPNVRVHELLTVAKVLDMALPESPFLAEVIVESLRAMKENNELTVLEAFKLGINSLI